MKFSLQSWHPFKWFSTPPMSKEQIMLYDLNAIQKELQHKQLELKLKEIDLDFQIDAITAKKAFIQSFGQPTIHDILKAQLK